MSAEHLAFGIFKIAAAFWPALLLLAVFAAHERKKAIDYLEI